MSFSEPYYPGLASSTGTRVDSAAKHNLACKVDTDLLRSWTSDSTTQADEEMRRNKYKFAMQKDELVMNTGMKISNSTAVTRTKTNAYPAVVTTMANCFTNNDAAGDLIKTKLSEIYSMPTCEQFFTSLALLEKIYNGKWSPSGGLAFSDKAYWNDIGEPDAVKQLKNMPFFRAQGYALGTAYASALTGDTVGTVIIGGVMTVLNGAFEMRAGQDVQWYFQFETENFEMNSTTNAMCGERKNAAKQERPSKVQRREAHHNRMYGMKEGDSNKGIFKIKPYVEGKGGVVYGDKIRVFAKCITGGRAFDHVDIMLMTQSM